MLVVWTLYEPDTISVASPKIRPELVGNCRACGYFLRMPPHFAAGSDYACASSSTARRFRISQSRIQSLQSRTTRVVCNGLLLRSLHSMTVCVQNAVSSKHGADPRSSRRKYRVPVKDVDYLPTVRLKAEFRTPALNNDAFRNCSVENPLTLGYVP